MKAALLVCHGWALTAKSLYPLSHALSPAFTEIHHLQLGYFEAVHIPRCDPKLPWIALGHSYGFARVLHELRKQQITPQAAIAINGFTRFPRSFAEIRVLQKGLTVAPALTLANFYHTHGLAPYQHFRAEVFQPEPLLADLHDIALHVARKPATDFCRFDTPVLSVAGAHDELICAEDLQRNFPHFPQFQSQILPQANHALGITDFTWCAEQIVNFLATLDEIRPGATS